MKKKLLALIALCLALVTLFSACASHGKTLIKAGSEKISVNVFQLYLSRMKYSLYLAGDQVDSKDYWQTIINTDNLTHAEYYTNQVLEGLKQIAAAMVLYDELGLKLSDADKDNIDLMIDTMIEEIGGGSKSQLNSILSAYGANVTVLRDAYEIEAKIAQLKTHLYGENASKVASVAKEEFYDGLYYRGKQMLIANYYYEYEKDSDGRPVYYQTDDKGNLKSEIAYDTNATPVVENEKTVYRKLDENAIAYDKKNGKISYEEDGTTPKRDKNGDVIYVTEGGEICYDMVNGREKDGVYYQYVIAYNKEKGAIKYLYDKKGEKKVAYFTDTGADSEMGKRLWLANKIATECAESDVGEALFDVAIESYADNFSFNETYAPNGMYFAKGSAMSDELFSKMASELLSMEIGDTKIMAASSGYYILMRVELDDGAWGETANKTWFESFNELLIEHVLQNKLKSEGYLDKIEVNEALLPTVDISAIDKNGYY